MVMIAPIKEIEENGAIVLLEMFSPLPFRRQNIWSLNLKNVSKLKNLKNPTFLFLKKEFFFVKFLNHSPPPSPED